MNQSSHEAASLSIRIPRELGDRPCRENHAQARASGAVPDEEAEELADPRTGPTPATTGIDRGADVHGRTHVRNGPEQTGINRALGATATRQVNSPPHGRGSTACSVFASRNSTEYPVALGDRPETMG